MVYYIPCTQILTKIWYNLTDFCLIQIWNRIFDKKIFSELFFHIFEKTITEKKAFFLLKTKGRKLNKRFLKIDENFSQNSSLTILFSNFKFTRGKKWFDEFITVQLSKDPTRVENFLDLKKRPLTPNFVLIECKRDDPLDFRGSNFPYMYIHSQYSPPAQCCVHGYAACCGSIRLQTRIAPSSPIFGIKSSFLHEISAATELSIDILYSDYTI